MLPFAWKDFASNSVDETFRYGTHFIVYISAFLCTPTKCAHFRWVGWYKAMGVVE